MRIRTIGQSAIIALILTACGSAGGQSPSVARPPNPVNLTVYVNDSHVSVSPARVGAGPITFIVTNQASQAESLAVLPAGSAAGQPLADTGPINPQATAQVTVNFTSPGTYSLSTGGGGSGSSIGAASIHVGPPRSNSNDQVLQP